MPASHLFQDFGTQKPVKAGKTTYSPEEIEEFKLQAFENGYQAGWDDAVKAQANTVTHVTSGLASSLQSASFDYHELRATLSASVQTIMEQVVNTALPQMAKASLGAHIRELVTVTARSALDRPIEISVAPENEDAVHAILSDTISEPFELIADPLMSPTQVVLRLGKQETEVNLDRLMADIGSAISTFFQTQNPEVSDGGTA